MESPLIFDQLCEICDSFLAGDASKYITSDGTTARVDESHSSFDSLISSVKGGCHLCSLIKGCISNHNSKPGWLDDPRTHKNRVLRALAFDDRAGHMLIDIQGGLMTIATKQMVISRVPKRKIENLHAARITPPHTLGGSSLRQIKEWMEHCVKNHELCRQSQHLTAFATSRKITLPTRLLDVSNYNGRPHVRLFHTHGLIGSTYVTLSHCWGSNPVISLLESNIGAFQRSIPFDTLPRTFQHAVEVTRALGYRYLWIDSLCIIQRQETNADWLRESAIIGDIYMNAVLNIAATASVDGSGGLFQGPIDLEQHPCHLRLPGQLTDESPYVCRHLREWHLNVEQAPLARRAWVVQERLLSTRIVHFAADQIYWECQSCMDSEFSPAVEYSSTDVYFMALKSTDPVEIYHNWEQTVERYTRCLLTFNSDKFVALAGLARRASERLGVEPSEYLAGIWKANMPRGLLWRIKPYSRRTERVLDRAPSWSWACINGEILAPRSGGQDTASGHVLAPGLRFGYEHLSYAHLIASDIKHLGDPFGAVISGSITIKGPVCAIQTIGPKGGNSIVEFSRGRLDCVYDIVSIMTSSIRWDDDKACIEGMRCQVYFLLIEESLGWCDGLVLLPIETERGCYHRLGQIMAKPSDITALLAISRNSRLLETARYLEADPEYGYTIVIR